MLKELDVDFEDILSLVIGKNNSGKTSLLSILQKFLSDNKPEFSFEDFSIEAQQKIIAGEKEEKKVEEYQEIALSLKLCITYSVLDDIGEAAILLMDLDDKNHKLIALYEYVLSYEKYIRLRNDYLEYKEKGIERDFEYFVSTNINKYFTVRIRAVEYGNEDNFKEISIEQMKAIIALQTIGAKRDVDNEQGHSKSLSILAGKYYNASVKSEAEFPNLQNQLKKTDEDLTTIYQGVFAPVVKEIADMSYNPHEAELSIFSTLSEKKIFQDNTTVKYKHNETLLPEDYNGLGYLNLFAIIFNIRIKLDQLSKKSRPDEKPTPLNLLFIEEPEAHTHPQMQYVFITNIKKVLENHCKEEEPFSLQTIISTHSSHIVSQCDFKDIKYFYRESPVSVKSRSLKKLYTIMVTAEDQPTIQDQERVYRFIKQYITLNRAELFFADKVILIEGDTERMLLFAMMKKLDIKTTKDKNDVPLLSQNISIIEVGAYSLVFATFLGFLNIKTLIITDLDSAKKGDSGRWRKCRYTEGISSTNASIKYFTGENELEKIISAPSIYGYDNSTDKWVNNLDGQLKIAFQKKQHNYQARSFEDAFISCNKEFIVNNKESFVGLKNIDKLSEPSIDFYDIADSCIDSKTSFALDVLMYGGEQNEKWNIPLYIEEGLQWLKQ
jgi:predicted ATP-dependent endonuclease of OLD family